MTQPSQPVAPPTGLSWRPGDPIRILGWIYLARIGLVTALLLRFPRDVFGHPNEAALILPLLVATVLFTAGSYLYTHSLHRRPGWPLLYAQVVFDALLLAGAVYLTDGPHSIFTPLFILIICAGALLLPTVGGIIIGLLASVLFLAAAIASSGGVDSTIMLQGSLFAVVALVSGYLGDRLRQTGNALGEVQTELRRLRLDTDDILETIGTGILTVDEQGRLAYLNPAAAEILSLNAAEWLDRPILDELDTIARGLGRVIEQTAMARTPIRRFETGGLVDDTFVLGVSTTPLERPGTGRPPITAIFQDITEKKRVEGLRRRAERLEVVAELGASLAHEIKNPLASIRSAVEQIAAHKVDAVDAELLGGVIVGESDRLSRLLGEFIDFARVRVVAPRPVDLTALARDVADVVRAHPDARQRRVDVVYGAPPDSVFVRGDADLLHRAVLNLLLNAVQWSPDGASVEISLDEVRSGLLSPALGALRLVRLAVRDMGPGVPEEIRDQIFDPFFTRRPGGTGLGLALVQRAVEAHGGGIFVDGSPGRFGGAAFSLYMPTVPSDLTLAARGLDEGAAILATEAL